MKIYRYERKFGRVTFDCGKETLNNYLKRNITKDLKNGSCTCFVIIDKDEQIIGYYTLSTDSIPIEEAPIQFQKKIKYQYVPVILLGRLAIDKNSFGKGLGQFMLVNALKKCLDVAIHHVGAVAVIVDPIDQDAKEFYIKYGFIELPDSGRMFMSIKTIGNAFER